ncbi:uroporphyrinogen-III synthase [Anoxybacillus gonensis]|uniref:Uroporphyrinogen-III synthase n=2 Tax=Anoxybacillus gonensis TaxID=198467 RepID=A0AAW7TJ84_9BACL|nr:uroporphyrinogen-III synthase [Anoxybacillus gonensis]MDO0877676.1 uroporphyrinogen-III synthase [Anoxybacillus gonensis]
MFYVTFLQILRHLASLCGMMGRKGDERMGEKALTNKKIALCASRKIEEMSALIVKQGGIPILRPAQGTMFFNEELKQQLHQMVNEPVDWFIFTTGIGVDTLMKKADEWGMGEKFLQAIRQAHVAVRGYKTTNVLRTYGISPHITAEDGTTQGLVHALKDVEWTDKRVVVQLYGDSAPSLQQFLVKQGALYQEIWPYRHTPPAADVMKQLIDEILSRTVQAVCFTSAIQVRFFFSFVKEWGYVQEIKRAFADDVVAVAVGKVTKEALHEEGIARVIAPAHERMGAMIVELAQYFDKQ